MSIPIAEAITANSIPDPLKLVLMDNATRSITYDSVTFPAVVHNLGTNFVLQAPAYDFYYVKMLQMNPGNPAGIQIAAYEKDLTENCTVPEPDIEIIVDGGRANMDPVSGQSTVNIPILADRLYRVVQRGAGPLIRGKEVTFLATGGFTLIGNVFAPGQPYFIQFFPPTITADPDIVVQVDSGILYDPLTGDSGYRNPLLKGKAFRVVARGLGSMLAGVNAEVAPVPAGGFDLLNGATFQNGEIYFVQVYPQLCVTQTGGGGVGQLFDGEVIVDVNTSYIDAHLHKLIVFRGAGEQVQYELPDINGFPFNVIIGFEANGGNQVYGAIVTKPAQYIDCRVPNQLNTFRVGLAQGEQVWISRGANNKWRVLWANWGYKEVGMDVFSSGTVDNTLPKDGAFRSKAVFWRIWDWVLQNAATSPPKNGAAWVADTGYFCDYDADSFRVPDDTGQVYKAVQAGRVPGSKELDQVGEFTLRLDKGDSYGGSSAGPQRFAPGGNHQPTDTITVNVGKETRIKNIGKIAQIKI